MDKEKSLALKASDSDETKLNEEQVAFIRKNFIKIFKKKSSNKKEIGSKNRCNDNTQAGFYNYCKTNHQIRNCPLWKIEWRKEKAENELKEKSKKKEKGKVFHGSCLGIRFRRIRR